MSMEGGGLGTPATTVEPSGGAGGLIQGDTVEPSGGAGGLIQGDTDRGRCPLDIPSEMKDTKDSLLLLFVSIGVMVVVHPVVIILGWEWILWKK